MAKAMTLAEIEAAFKKWGVRYTVYPGAANRGRGPFSNVVGIVDHHTGSDAGQGDSYDTWLFTEGRPKEGIPAPLANFTVDMDGDVHIGAIGRANHAGRGSSRTYNHILNEDYPGYTQTIAPGPDDFADGNGSYYGFECKYDGGQPMTNAMWNSLVRANAAICDHYGWTALSVLGHKEHTSRKNDPGNVSMPILRNAIRLMLASGPDGKKEDMATNDEILADLNAYQKVEDNRYKRMEAIHTETMKAISELPAKIAAAIKAAQ